ncbi:hypothetical protein B0J17DRAFT_624589 [Rhizoctonia solani]|nr:hypothetical protein B0J17DRAFT_624589 [Rhizoctonia solani]
MAASRSRQRVIVPTGMYPEVRRHLPTSKLEKAIAPTWTDIRVRIRIGPKANQLESGQRNVWIDGDLLSFRLVNLLAPYNTTITEDQWKAYYEEHSALDRINTVDSIESDVIQGKYLDENTWKVLRKAAEHIASAILASALDNTERKQNIARTSLGSLYFILGAPEPRNLDTTTRLYSPFGLGTSIDFHYNYHYRKRSYVDERDTMLNAAGREIGECDPDNPTKCAAEPEFPEDDEEEDDEEGK